MKVSNQLRFCARVAVLATFATLNAPAKADSATLALIGVGTDTNGAVLLQFAPGSFNTCGCLIVPGNYPGAKQILATALLAKALTEPLFVNRVVGTSGAWGISDYATEIRLVN